MQPMSPYSVGVVVKHHQVAVAHVEARQMVAGVLGVKDVLINHVGRPSGFWGVSAESAQDFSVRMQRLLR